MGKVLGTCVIGEVGSNSAFVSVECEGQVWARRFASLEVAVKESKRLGLIDKLFAAAAPNYVRREKTPCVAPLHRWSSREALIKEGFRQPGGTVAV